MVRSQVACKLYYCSIIAFKQQHGNLLRWQRESFPLAVRSVLNCVYFRGFLFLVFRLSRWVGWVECIHHSNTQWRRRRLWQFHLQLVVGRLSSGKIRNQRENFKWFSDNNVPMWSVRLQSLLNFSNRKKIVFCAMHRKLAQQINQKHEKWWKVDVECVLWCDTIPLKWYIITFDVLTN